MKRLTQLQRDVLALVLQGKSNREIATQLGRDEDAVKHCVRRSLLKWGITRRNQILPKIDQMRERLAAYSK